MSEGARASTPLYSGRIAWKDTCKATPCRRIASPAVIEEMRLWRVARSAEQIRSGMEADDGRGAGGFDSPGVNPASDGLVAYWR